MTKAKILISIILIIISIIRINSNLNKEIANSNYFNNSIIFSNEINEAQKQTIEENMIVNLSEEKNNKLDDRVKEALSNKIPYNSNETFEEKEQNPTKISKAETGIVNVYFKEIGTNINVMIGYKLKGKVGEQYKISAPETVMEFKLVKIPENATGTFKNESIDVIYYYKKEEVRAVENDNKNNKENLNKTIIDEIIESLDIKQPEDKALTNQQNESKNDIKEDYEILMDSNDADYFIYYKKQ